MDSHWRPPGFGEGGTTPSVSSPSPNLRKPRLVKQRKHGSAPRPQPAVSPLQGGGFGMGLFPARSEDVTSSLFRDGVSGISSSGGHEPRVGRPHSGKAEILGYDFRAGLVSEKTSDLEGSNPTESKTTSFIFGSSSGGIGGVKDENFAFGGSSPTFTFRGSKKISDPNQTSSLRIDERMTSWLPDEMGRLNIDSAGEFGCGDAKFAGSQTSSVFKSGIGATLSEEMRKLKVGTTDYSSTAEASTNYGPGINRENPPVCSDGKISALHEEMNKLKIKAIHHGIHEEKATHDDLKAGRKNPFVFGAGLAGDLSEDLTKLNIETSGSNKQPVESSKDKVEANKGSFGFPVDISAMDPPGMRKSNIQTNAHLRVQGSKVTMTNECATTVSVKESDNPDPSLLSNLHHEIRKLNIVSTGNVPEKVENTDDRNAATKSNNVTDMSEPCFSEGTRGPTVSNTKLGYEKGSKVVHPSSQPDKRNKNIFGINKSTSGHFGVNTGNGLPEKINQFNFANESMSQLGKDRGLHPGCETFVFGGSVRTPNISTFSNATGLDADMPAQLPDDAGMLNIRSPVEVGSTREDSQCSKSMESGSFVFSFGSSSVPLKQESSPSLFTFQARSFDASSDARNMTSSNTRINLSRGPSRTSSFGLDFSSGNTAFAFMGSGGLDNSSTDHHKSKDSSWVPQGGSFPGIHPELSPSKKTGSLKNVRHQKRKVKLKNHAVRQDNVFLEKENNLQDDSEFVSPGSCSPMDFSPYQETVISDQCSREASVSSDGLGSVHTPVVAEPLFYDDNMENLVSAAENMVINDHVMNLEQDDGAGNDNTDASFDTLSSYEKEQVLEPFHVSQIHGTETIPTADEKQCDLVRNPNVIPVFDTENTDNQASDGKMPLTFCSTPDASASLNFMFSASSSNQVSALPSKRLNRKKSQLKMGSDSISSSLNEKFLSISSPINFSNPDVSKQIDLTLKLGPDVGVSSISKTEEKKFEAKEDFSAREVMAKTSSETLAALEACEKWRLRGNQAYADGHLSKAEEYYTHGVDSTISQSDKCEKCMQALKLCYSNRAAARMSLGRIREALNDCKKAIAIEQSFVKALLRAANCHLALGEAAEAVTYFRKCLKLVNDSNLADKMLDEASHGLQKAQKVLEYIGRCSELAKKNSHDAMTDVLGVISEAQTLSPYSEYLIEMKANALFMLRQYDEAIKLCEKTKDISERNSSSISSEDHIKDELCNCIEHIPEKVWRLHLISKSYFYQGKVEEALHLLQKNGLAGSATDKCGNKLLGSLASFAQTLQELLRLKVEGNNAFTAGRHMEAVEYYSKALACSIESRPFSAICFCNRAAAYQSLGQITDAIADCSLAIALDAKYPKAISRRATLHEMIRDYAQAARDLNKLTSLLEAQANEQTNDSGELRICSRNSDDLKRAHQRLITVEDEARKGIPLDMYMILGIASSSSPADIKKAYRKAALKHHPDKACHLLAKGDNNDDTLWKDVASEVHKDADYLFKIIGEAYAILSDPNKRLQYDAEEERFVLTKEFKGYEDFQSKYDKSGSKQQSWNNWTSQGSSHKKWPGYSQSNWYFQKGK